MVRICRLASEEHIRHLRRLADRVGAMAWGLIRRERARSR
jgi:hypothetical protein